MGLIFYLSNIPGLKTQLGVWDLIFRKLAHMFEFGVLFLLLFKAFSESIKKYSYTNLNILSGIIAVVYAVSDEYHQSFVPERGPSVYDVGIDAVGILIAVMILWYYKKKRRPDEAWHSRTS
ncbi:VanZ family protein [Elusimicrobiota bacterium]